MIKKEHDRILIEFPKSLYSEQAIDRAMRDFSDVSSIIKEENSEKIIIVFNEQDMLPALEFCNYALGMHKIYGTK